MNELALDNQIRASLDYQLRELETKLNSDVIFFYGDIYYQQELIYRTLIECLQNGEQHRRLTIIINTPGGNVATVEKFSNINRYFYDEVFFIVPDSAMSAGTVFCLSGDKIYMEYSSSLGPIDPQIWSPKQNMWVPALGYLDKMNEMIQKSLQHQLSDVEYLLLKDLDLGFIRDCEQQKNLTIALIKEWLVKYKFKNWNNHHTTKAPVTLTEKTSRAEEIARQLGDNNLWYTHGRCIDIIKLKDILKLEIDDYSSNIDLKNPIRNYNNLILSYIHRNKIQRFLHGRNFF